MNKHTHPLLELFLPLVKFLAIGLGPDYEIVLFSVLRGRGRILTIENCRITGRSAQSFYEDLVEELLDQANENSLVYLSNYMTRGQNGGKIRTNAFFIKDDEQKIVGVLAINYDVTKALVAKEMIDQLVSGMGLPAAKRNEKVQLDTSVEEMQEENLRRMKKLVGKPLQLCNKQEKLQIIKILDSEGFFLLKGSVEILAKATGNTKFTIYSYLREIRGKADGEHFERGYL